MLLSELNIINQTLIYITRKNDFIFVLILDTLTLSKHLINNQIRVKIS